MTNVMKCILSNRFAPTTFCVGFLEAPLEAVVDADAKWRKEYGKYSIIRVRGDLGIQLTQLGPLTGPQCRCLWSATTGKWTTYFDNSIIGSDPISPISFLSEQLGCRGLLIS